MQPQPLNPYDPRDRHQSTQGPPTQPPALQQRQPSPPRQDLRYREPQRPPPPAHRGLSPSPKGQQSTPAAYGASHHQPPMHHAHPQHQPVLQNKPYAHPIQQAPPPQVPTYARQPSPRSEVRPLMGTPAASTNNNQYPRMSYDHQHTPSSGSNGPVHHQAEPLRDREERTSSVAPKRVREWEDEHHNGIKKHSTDDARSRLDEIKMHRPSPPQKLATPPNHSPSELRRTEEMPQPPSTYRPSEAAHHPPPAQPILAPVTQTSPPRSVAPQEEASAPAPPPQSTIAATPTPAVYEPAARKMEVDENYDDSGDDEKRSSTKHESRRGSPRSINGTSAPAIEQKA